MDINETLITAAEGDDANERLDTASQDEDIDARLRAAAQDGDIERFYGLLAEDPNILERFDRLPFCETPLHVAARHWRTHFAMELMNLKPSLAWKLNESGFSPMHLALQNDCFRMVRGFMALESNLISIKGRGRITPLHYVAQIGDVELLSELLSACPSSIEDLTVKCETAVHIAAKNHKLYAFKVLLGWIKRVNREEILNWKDEDGNTVFHIATSTNQTEVMKLLRKIVNVNAKNLDGQTAMDIFQSNRASLSPEMSKILRGAKAEAAYELTSSTKTLAGYLSQGLSLIEKRNKLLGLNNLTSDNKHGSCSISDFRSSVLVVAILIATATYQAGLSPPGGYWQETTVNPTANNTYTDEPHIAGQMILPSGNALVFCILNGIAFLLSIFVIAILVIGLPMWKVIYGATAALGVSNFASLGATFPIPHIFAWQVTGSVLVSAYPIVTGLIVFVPYMAFSSNKRHRRRVDFPARYFSSSRDLTY